METVKHATYAYANYNAGLFICLFVFLFFCFFLQIFRYQTFELNKTKKITKKNEIK